MSNKPRHYAFMGKNDDDCVITMPDGQMMAGHPIGIMLLRVNYPIVPGNVANATTFDFPVRYVKVLGVDSPRLHTFEDSILDDLVAAGEELERDGVRAIICACGYFGYWQKELRDRLNVPVFTSSLVQLPMIKMSLRKEQKVGVLCAVGDLDERILTRCGVDDPSYVVIKTLENAPEFSGIPLDRHSMNSAVVRQEVVQAAKELVAENPDIGAILLECSDMPPYADAVQKAVNLPVYDFTTMINWVHSAICRKPFYGWY